MQASDAGPRNPPALPRLRPAPLAAGAATRRAGTLRRGPGGDPRRDRASGLCSDRHDPCDRALPPPHPVLAHSGVPARRSAPGAEHRSLGLRVLDPRTLLRADARPALFPARHAAGLAGPAVVQGRTAGRDPQSPRPDRQRRPPDDPRHRRRRAGREGSRLGEPQALEARAAARLLRGAADRERAGRHAQDLRAGGPPFRLGDAAEGGI